MSQLLVCCWVPSQAIRLSSSIPLHSNSPTLSPLPFCASPPHGHAHTITAWHGLTSLAKNHHPATAHASKPAPEQALRDFPSHGSSDQLTCKHQKVQLILCTFIPFLQAKLSQTHLFDAYTSIELAWLLKWVRKQNCSRAGIRVVALGLAGGMWNRDVLVAKAIGEIWQEVCPPRFLPVRPLSSSKHAPRLQWP